MDPVKVNTLARWTLFRTACSSAGLEAMTAIRTLKNPGVSYHHDTSLEDKHLAVD
jgi:hypothetical protein